MCSALIPQKAIPRIHPRIPLLDRKTYCLIPGGLSESRGMCSDLSSDFIIHAYNPSLLLHSILLNGTYAPQRGSERLTRADFDRIGMLSFTQLAELRHRGAFSAVAQTFTTCCQCCGRSKEPSISSLPAAWYLVRTSILHSIYIVC